MSAARRRGVAGSSAVMFAGTLVSRVLGMVKSPLLLGAAIGINFGAANAFSVANKLPNLIYMLIAGGVLNAVLVPQIVRAIRNDADRGQAYVNRLLTLAMVGLGSVTVLLTLAAPLLVSLYAVNLPQEWYDVAVSFGYWCIPQLFFYGMYTLLGQVLNAREIFGPYMWAPALNNVVAILGLGAYLVVFGGTAAADDASAWTTSRVALLAGTATLGIVAQAVVLLVPLHRSGFRYRPQWGLRGSGLGKASRMAMWVFAALAANQAAYVVVSNAAAYAFRAGGGARDVAGNGAYDTAFLIYTLPTSLVTVSLVTALFTRMSSKAAAADLRAVRADLSVGLRTVSVFTVFATGALMVLALPVVRIIAATVTYAEVQSIANVVVAMLGGLVAVGVFTMCQRVYYAFEDARGLFRLQIPMILVLAAGAAASMLLPPRWTVVGIGVAMTLSNWIGALVTYLGLRQHLRTIDGGRVLRTHLRLVLAAVPSTLVGWGLLHLLGVDSGLGIFGALWRIAVVGTVMGVLYVVALRRLRVDELDTLARPVGKVLVAVGRRAPAPVGGMLVRAGAALAPAAVATTRSGGPDDHDGGPGGGPDGGPAGGPGGGPGGGPVGGPDGGPAGGPGGGPGCGSDSGSGRGPEGGPGGPGRSSGGGPGDTSVPDTGSPVPAPVAAAENVTVPPVGAAAGDPVRTLGHDARTGAEHDADKGSTALEARTDDAGRGTRHVLDERYELGAALETTVGGVDRRRAHDTILDRPVEALVLPPAGSGVADVLDAARRAALVEDHRLAQVLDVGSDGTSAYVVTDPVTGPSLAELTAHGPLEAEQARAVIGEATSALESARRHGVRHLALRPEALHVTPDGEVLITGLGTDAVLLGLADPDGSPLAATRRDATDLVRLLYLCLTGLWPAVDEEPPAPRSLNPEVPGDLDELCTRTLVDNDGPRSTGELIRLLAPWPDVDAASVLGPPPAPPSAAPAPSAPPAAEPAEGAPAPGSSRTGEAPSAGPAGNGGSTGAGAAAAVATGAAGAAGAAVAGSTVAGAAAGTEQAGGHRLVPTWARVHADPEPVTDPAAAAPPAPMNDPTATAPLDAVTAVDPDAVDDAAVTVAGPATAVQPTAGGPDAGPAPAPPSTDPAAVVGPPPPPPVVPSSAPAPAGTAALPLQAATDRPATAPGPRTLSWTPKRPASPAQPPGFPQILDVTDADRATPSSRHTKNPGALAGLAVIAGSAVESLKQGARKAAEGTKEGARKAAEGTRTAAAATRETVGSAVVAGKEKVAEAGEARRSRPETAPIPTQQVPVRPSYDDDSLSAVDGPEVPFAERRINPTPVVLVAVAALVLVLFLVATRTLLAPPEPVSLPRNNPAPTASAEPTPTAEPTPEQSATTQEPAAGPPLIASLAPLDPEGDGGENPDLASRAMDGDPATYWRSRSYVNPEYGMKTGIGLAVTLQQPATVSSVEIDLRGTGGLVQIRSTSPETPTEGDVLAEGEMGPGTVFRFDPVETESLVLWFPRLPTAESDGKNRIELAEVRVG
ncbi:murein biosynthesis integral membrane protein MurJ [Georgenia soli]|uniref:Murein biosynthesis integral membrane protein MurJ n=1 Tax=Georgenia soli TaxID=638953 RepID=A0A2A9ENG8_9MICO|nr:murein biosynthesis integral membrane protein MurJ [Georgenia soli]PFG39795.1 murein biosynthesis integral membrane protein MurJ [Georgenia soli]